MDEDASGLNFEEWDPSEDTDTSEAPVAMFVKLARGARRRFRPQRSDTSATRGDGAWRTSYAWRGPQEDSRHGYQEVCFGDTKKFYTGKPQALFTLQQDNSSEKFD